MNTDFNLSTFKELENKQKMAFLYFFLAVDQHE